MQLFTNNTLLLHIKDIAGRGVIVFFNNDVNRASAKKFFLKTQNFSVSSSGINRQ